MSGSFTAPDADPYRGRWWATMGLGCLVGAILGHPLAGGLVGLAVLLVWSALADLHRAVVARRDTGEVDAEGNPIEVPEQAKGPASPE